MFVCGKGGRDEVHHCTQVYKYDNIFNENRRAVRMLNPLRDKTKPRIYRGGGGVEVARKKDTRDHGLSGRSSSETKPCLLPN